MAMGIVDTMFVGRVSAEAIGAVSLGTSIFYAIAIFASGLLLGLDTLVSQAFGAGDLDDCHHSLVSGIWLALFLIPGVMGAVWLFVPLMARLGINASVLQYTTPYIRALNWSAPPLLLFFSLRRYLQSIGVVRPVLITLITANLVNAAGIFDPLPIAGSRKFAGLLHARLKELPVGRCPHVEATAEFVRALNDFLPKA